MVRTESLILLHGHYNTEHLEQVKREMVELGSPRLHAVYDECNGTYNLLEGCHRARAAVALGVTIILLVIDPYDYETDEPLDSLPGLGLDSDNTTLDEILIRGAGGDQFLHAECEVILGHGEL